MSLVLSSPKGDLLTGRIVPSRSNMGGFAVWRKFDAAFHKT
jgi:hypothetical protein